MLRDAAAKRAVAVRYGFFVTTARRCVNPAAHVDKARRGGPSAGRLHRHGQREHMQANDIQFLAESLLPVALAAARVQMGYFGTGVAAATKADNSPVTVADQESEAIILEALARVAPGVPVVSEEAAA